MSDELPSANLDGWTVDYTIVILVILSLVVWAIGLRYIGRFKLDSGLIQQLDLITMGLSIAGPLSITVYALATVPGNNGFLCVWIIMPPLFTAIVLLRRITKKS